MASPTAVSGRDAERSRLLEMHEAAARFYQAQLAAESSGGPSRYLRDRGISIDGPGAIDDAWVIGYAVDAPTALVNELVRLEFQPAEIRAAGLAVVGESGQLEDTFQQRIVVGFRHHSDSTRQVVGFVGYAPPQAGSGVAQRIHSPSTILQQPDTILFGLADQRKRQGGPYVLARGPLEAIELSAKTADHPTPPVVVSTLGGPFTERHAAALGRLADTAAGVSVVAGRSEASRREAERVQQVLTATLERLEAARAQTYDLFFHPDPPGEVRIVRSDEVVASAPRQQPQGITADRPSPERRPPTVALRSGRATRVAYEQPPLDFSSAALDQAAAGQPEHLGVRGAGHDEERPSAPVVVPDELGTQASVTATEAGPASTDDPANPVVPQADQPTLAAERRGSVPDLAMADPGQADPALSRSPRDDRLSTDAQAPAPAEVDESPALPTAVQATPEEAAEHEPPAAQGHENEAEAPGDASHGTGPEERTGVGPNGEPVETAEAALTDQQPAAAAGNPVADEQLLDPTEAPLADQQPAAAAEAGGHALPDDAKPVEGADGYHYTRRNGEEITVYGPDNAPVATGNYVRGGTAGEVDGVRIPAYGWRTSDFPLLAARQHRAANSPAEQRDRVWVEIVPDSSATVRYVVVVHGTIRDNALDDRATKDVANFYWSRPKNARVSGRKWTQATVDRNFTALLQEFALQGRNVLVSNAKRGLEQTPAPASERAAAPAAGPQPREESVSAPDPPSMTDEELLNAYWEARTRAGYGTDGDVAAARLEELGKERQERILRRVAAAPDVTGMTDEEVMTEERWLISDFARHAFTGNTEAEATVKPRLEAVRNEGQGRQARSLMAGPAPAELADEPLTETYQETHLLRALMPREHPDRAALSQRSDALLDEMAARRIVHYEQRPDIAGLTLEELGAESVELISMTEDSALSRREDVAQAREARLRAVDAEINRLEEARFPNELARAKFRGESALQRVSIDDMPDDYGRVIATTDRGFEAKVGYTEILGYFPSRPAAVVALVQHYDQNPKTLPQRTWGVPRDVVLPIGAREERVKWLRPRSGAEATAERRRLWEILEAIPIQEPHRNPLTGKTMRAYSYRVEEGLLGELSRIAERVTMELREQSVNPDLPKQDREAAKRRIPTMGAALHNINTVRERANAAGIDTDRRAVDENQVAAQLAALAGDVELGTGGSSDSEQVQPDSQTALGAVSAQGVGHDREPGGVLRQEGAGVAGSGDRSAGGAGADAASGDRLPGADWSAEPDSGHRRAAGDGGASAASGGRREPAHAAESAPEGTGRDPAGPARPLARFRPDPADIPRTPMARAAANLEAIKVLRRLEQERRPATDEDKQVLASWSGWGSVPAVFLEQPDEENPAYGAGGEREGRYTQDLARWESYSRIRDELRELLDPFEWNAAARATLSAYYTPQALADAMWDGLQAFGFDGGEVLEAGSGSGVFFGAAPDSETVRLTGVELDPTTARISQLIYPHANVLIESFADTDAPAGAFDAAIGNVPWAHLVPFTESRYGAGGHRLPDGFLIKDLALVREGGLVIAVTSRWTLDREHESARHQMARYGDLVAAYRLPVGVLAETAGTNVLVDVLVFRRGPEGQDPADAAWLHAPKREVNGSTYTISAYFTEHPDHVLGELTTVAGRFGPELTVKGDPVRAVQDLRAALSQAAELAKADGRAYEPHPQGIDRKPLNLQTAREKHATDYTGRLYVGEDSRIWQHINGADPVEAIPSDGNTQQLLALMRLRDLTAELKELDRIGDEPGRAEELRARVRTLHGAYARKFGPLSRPGQIRLATARHVRDAARQEDRQVSEGERTPTAWGWFREDPDAASVLALESWDRQRQAPVPSEVLTRRPGTQRAQLQRTDDPKVALTAVLGATGQVDLNRVADLLGTSPDEARRRLGTEVFDNPATGRLEHAGAYLSGAVRRKLEEARVAAAADPSYAVNMAALEAVQPREKRMGQFTPQLGAHWIPPSLVQGFLRQYLGDPTLLVHHNDRYGWTVHAGKVPDAINALKGTGRRSALQIARAVLGNGSLTVEDAVARGDKIVREVDEDATRAARQKADAMRSAFEEYLTADSTRVKVLTQAYNRVMNGHVVRNYDGLAPSLMGFTDHRTPHPHQLAGAARMQFERGVILAHEVGLGKTTTLIIGTQALKASGQISKPFAVVQRHLAKQWLDEARFLYPNADIRLITSEMLSGDERRRTLEWLRSNTPDLTIFTEGAFTSAKMSPEYQEWYEFQDIANLREQILRERGVPDNILAVRKLEQRLATQEARLRRNAAPMRAPGELYWEDLGFDYAAIDELHRFRGVGFRSKTGGGDTAKIRAVDLHQKLTQMHREAAARGGRPTVTGATGTPLTNSIAEQYTMLALISPWVLEEFGVAGPDLWADTFGQRVQRIEMAPDGSGLKVVERFSRFISKSTMKTMWGLTADTKTADEVGIERPRVVGGGPQLHLVDPTADQQTRLKKLVARGAAIHAGEVSRQEDNMLAVAYEGRAIACDPRLLDSDAPPGSKLDDVADWFAARYHANKDRVYAVSKEDPTPHPVPGSLDIGFLNLGTPGGKNKGNFDAYATLRDLCVARGVPAEKIAFVQEHNHNPDQLGEFYRRCHEGEVAIVLASTDTMGTGANVQNRLAGLAHIDFDWTPASMDQRNGRGVRWGNQNDEVEIAMFALRGSMDSWQAGLLAAKAEGLRDIQRPDLTDDGDTVQEVGEVELDYATMVAEIGGNPYMRQLIAARDHLAGLESTRRIEAADRLRQSELLREKEAEAAVTRQAIARRAEVMPLITSVRGEDFAIQIGGADYTERKDAGPALRRAVNTHVMQQRAPGLGPWHILGHFGGLPLGVRAEMTSGGELKAQLGFPDLRHSEAEYSVDDLTREKVGGTMLSRLSTVLENAPAHQALDHERLPGLDEEIALLSQQQAATDFTERIEHARRRVELLDDVVAAIAERDKFPELNAESLDPKRYRTEEQRQQAVAARAGERVPLQAKVDHAVEMLETFDREHAERAGREPDPRERGAEGEPPAAEPQQAQAGLDGTVRQPLDAARDALAEHQSAAAVDTDAQLARAKPETLAQRTWGMPRELVLPVVARNELLNWLQYGSDAEATPDRERLAEILGEFPKQERHRDPLTGDTMRVYRYRIEEGLLDEVTRILERVTSDVREHSVNPEVPERLRDGSQRQIPIMDAALHIVNSLREETNAAAIETDRDAVDDKQAVVQLAAPAGSFTALEHAKIRIAVEDHAARYFGGPLGRSREAPARYVSEGHLGDLIDKYKLGDLWRAVAAHIEAHPELLERNEAERAAAQAARREQAAAVDRDAMTAYEAGDLDRAGELIDAAELIDPDFGDKGRSWRLAREAIEEARANGRDGGSLAQSGPEAAPAAEDRAGVVDGPVPVVPGTVTTGLPEPLQPTRGAIAELEAAALTDPKLTQAARVNDKDNVALVARRWIDDYVATTAKATDSYDFAAFKQQVADTLNEYIIDRVWALRDVGAAAPIAPITASSDMQADARVRWVEEHAPQLAGEVGEQAASWWRRAARDTLSIERDKRIALEEARKATALTGDYEGQAANTDALGQTKKRQELRELADVKRSTAAGHRRSLANRIEAEWELFEDGRHLSGLVANPDQLAARLVRADRKQDAGHKLGPEKARVAELKTPDVGVALR